MKVDFSKGINTRTEPATTPPGFYRDAMNMRESGGSLHSEEGTVQIINAPADIKIWGSCSIEDETIVLATVDGASVIGVIYNVNVDPDVPDTFIEHYETLLTLSSATCPNFQSFIQVEGRLDWKGDRVIYFSEGGAMYRIDVDSSLSGGSYDCTQSEVTGDYMLPLTEFVNVTDDGSVPSGTYQFFTRLRKNTGEVTNVGPQTGPIPIYDDPTTNDDRDKDGAPPQTPTNKRINLTISDIDQNYDTLEIIVVTYIGIENTVKTYALHEVPISGETISVSFSGNADLGEEISLEDLIVTKLSLEGYSFSAQKDNTYLIAGAKEKGQPDINWFDVALKIKVAIAVKPLVFTQATYSFTKTTFDDLTEVESLLEDSSYAQPGIYKDPKNCESYKSLRRNESYGFTLTPVFTNGLKGPTVHIPAFPEGGDEIDPTASTFGLTLSTHTYPDGMYEGLDGAKIRLFKVPSAKQIPLVTSVEVASIGVTFSGILDAIPTEHVDKVAGIIFGRLDKKGHETQLAQGIARITSRPVESEGFSMEYFDGEIMSILPGLGKCNFHMATTYTQGYTIGKSYAGLYDVDCNRYDSVTFVAPDYIHNLYDTSIGNSLEVSNIQSAVSDAGDTAFYDASSHACKQKYRHFFTHAIDNADDSKYPAENKVSCGITDRLAVPPSGTWGVQSGGTWSKMPVLTLGSRQLKYGATDGFVWFLLNKNMWLDNLEDGHLENITEWESYQYSTDFKDIWQARGNSDITIYTVTKKNSQQYGPLDKMVSMEIGYHKLSFGDSTTMYRGDTFITKYGLTLRDQLYWYGSSQVNCSDNKEKFFQPEAVSGIAHIWIESDNNYDLRHYIDEIDKDTLPYYPKYTQLVNRSESPLGILSYNNIDLGVLGYPSQYNNQYSAMQNIKPYPLTPYEDVIYDVPVSNRIYVSAVSIEGEKEDAYVDFTKVNRYYDIPREFGAITDIFVAQGELYASTAQTIWRLFYNTTAAQATSAGDVVLGTAGMFTRPAIPLTTVDGGSGGITHWLHSVSTPYGKVFVDKREGLIYSMNQGNLKEVTDSLDDNLQYFIRALSLTDAEEQIRLGLDLSRDRVMCRLGPLTMSFSLNKLAFISRHIYISRYMFNHGSKLYLDPLEASYIHRSSIGQNCVFFGEPEDSFVVLISNQGADTSKLFTNFEIIANKYKDVDLLTLPTKMKGPSTKQFNSVVGAIVPFEHFDEYEIWNRERYTGIVSIKPRVSMMDSPAALEVLSDKIKDVYRMPILADIVVDPNTNKFDTANHAQLKGEDKVSWLPRIRGTFIEIKLIKLAEPNDKPTRGAVELLSVNVTGNENIR